jgi:hypothetical protein
MWRELIKSLTNECTFFPPASFAQLVAVEKALAVTLPDELRELLAETNGVKGEYGFWLVWPTEKIEKDNLFFRSFPDFRELYMPFEPLLFFAEYANSDLYAYIITSVGITRRDIFIWEHESDSRREYTFGLARYLERWVKESG